LPVGTRIEELPFSLFSASAAYLLNPIYNLTHDSIPRSSSGRPEARAASTNTLDHKLFNSLALP